MSLFQKSVVNKYLSNLDSEEFTSAYNKFKEFYGDSERIENIKLLKEENYQEGFLREIFVEVLGYTINPDKNYNLTTEYKNETDSKKADGAILQDGNAIGVIELKSTKTVNLESITTQAFNYKNHQSSCKYVITSNFEKLRFYIDNATEWEEFNLFTMTEEEFKLFYLLLSSKNLLSGIPQKIKDESRLHEENISDKLYKDYSRFKQKIYNNLIENNTQYDKLVLFKKSQKLLDRILFILFAEDSGLVPPNAISKIVDQWKQLKALDEEKPLYSRFVKFFNHLNVGHTYEDYTLPAYNGGLFSEDDILDTVKIDDEVLLNDILNLSAYDFSTEVDVNILGHIFEHSLTEIEEVTAQIEGTLVEREKSKRKKEGIFYTPKYITKYIVDNTVGTLCNEKKKELQLDKIDETILENSRTTKGKLTKKAQDVFSNLDKYREYILSLKILDPACGSGAFLNQALEFLIREHNWIDEQKSTLLKEGFTISEYEKDIVENNLYGVDINEEAVEIAKLSLWLRTAKKGRKLSTLSNNIKCGNSLIDDPEVAGEKAFNWNEEFKEIMSSGGFDVVIGNPPYVNISSLPKSVHLFFEKVYATIHTGYNDLMYYFLFKGIDILNEQGIFGMITSNYFIGNEYAKLLRRYLSNHISSILNFGDYHVFKDANVHTAIVFAKKLQTDSIVKYTDLGTIKPNLLSIDLNCFEAIKKERGKLGDYWLFTSTIKNKIVDKLLSQGFLLGEIAEIEKGSTSGKNDVFTISKEQKEEYGIESELLRPNVKNGDIHRYSIFDRQSYLIYTDNNTDIESFPCAYSYLKKHRNILENRNEVKKGAYNWWRLERPRRKIIFDSKEKIIVPYRSATNRFAYDNQQRFNDGGDIRVIVITSKQFLTKYVLSLLNSKLIDWYYGFIGKPKGNSREYFNEPLAKIPIVSTKNSVQTSIINKVEILSNKLYKLQKINLSSLFIFKINSA